MKMSLNNGILERDPEIRKALLKDMELCIQKFHEANLCKERGRLVPQGFGLDEMADAILSGLEKKGWHGIKVQ